MSKRANEAKKALFKCYYENFNEGQRNAILQVNGPVLVVAGAGSGKTQTVVHRIAHIIRFGNAYYDDHTRELTDEEIEDIHAGVNGLIIDMKYVINEYLHTFVADPCPPDRILTITFTNKAAAELKSRLKMYCPDAVDQIWASTFHSFCVKLLHIFSDYTSYGKNFVIYDQDDCKRIITRLMKENNIDSDRLTPKTVLSTISRYKNSDLSIDVLKSKYGLDLKKGPIIELFEKYQAELESANALDFDDILLVTLHMLQNESVPREWCQNKFKYVLVDEYQDTNPVQFQIVKIICEKHRNIMVVGDDDQSIYKFRGATIENILNFDKDYPDAKIFHLDINYRSTRKITEAANHLISNNRSRREKTMKNDNDFGEKLNFRQLRDQEEEAAWIGREIINEVVDDDDDKKYGDYAILYRTNAQSNVLETTFAKMGLPHRIMAGTRFYDHTEIKDIIAYLRLIVNHDDTYAFERIINVPKRGLGKTFVDRILEKAKAENTSPYHIISRYESDEDLRRYREKLRDFVRLIHSFTQLEASALPSEIVRRVIEDTGYQVLLLDEENKNRRENLQELVSSAIAYENREPNGSLLGFLEEVSLISDVDNYDENADAVVMMTIHSSKGMEFRNVYLPGFEENLFPSPRSSATLEDLEEERRLAYVAITRCKEVLRITSAKSRLLFGKVTNNDVSRFLQEIPPELIDVTYYDQEPNKPTYQKDKPKKKTPEIVFVNTFERRLNRPAIPPDGLKRTPIRRVFEPGTRIRHNLFGQGTVLSAKKVGSDVLYEIEFDKTGRKRLMGTYAKMVRIK